MSRSLKACEGALLIVDATQGIQAQTLANAYLAIDNDLEILPVINKIDLPSADIEMARRELEDILGIPADDAPAVSAKLGTNIRAVLEQMCIRDSFFTMAMGEAFSDAGMKVNLSPCLTCSDGRRFDELPVCAAMGELSARFAAVSYTHLSFLRKIIVKKESFL